MPLYVICVFQLCLEGPMVQKAIKEGPIKVFTTITKIIFDH